jgi:hypothetical protein
VALNTINHNLQLTTIVMISFDILMPF